MDGSIGLGHAMLRTTRESLGERQPANLDGRFWIVADARLDGRPEFIVELQRSGRVVRPDAPDCELILHAYAAWGSPCVEHLRGDFSFAIWDARNKQLFCARDHFGIKPFYYVQRGNLLLFSNTLNCVRTHPEVSGELNDVAIGDFLLFGLNCDNATTSFRDIQRLPPAHCLTISADWREAQALLDSAYLWTDPIHEGWRLHRTFSSSAARGGRGPASNRACRNSFKRRTGFVLGGGGGQGGLGKERPVHGHSVLHTRFESLIPDREGEYARESGRVSAPPRQNHAVGSNTAF